MIVEEIRYGEELYEDERRRVDVAIFAEDEVQQRQLAEGCSSSGLTIHNQADLATLKELVRGGQAEALPEVVVIHTPIADAEMLATLAQLDEDLALTSTWVVVVTTMISLDEVFGCLNQVTSTILVRPTEADQLLLFARIRSYLRSSVVREFDEEDKLAVLRLTEQVEALMRNMSNWGAGAPENDGTVVSINSAAEPTGSPPTQIRRTRAALPDPRLVRAVLRQRQKRNELFGAELFADPAWDMLLDLTAARAEHRRVSVTSLCIASGVPATTALRWIGQMVESGLLARVRDTEDARRAFIELTERSVEAMTRYFADVAPAEAMAA